MTRIQFAQKAVVTDGDKILLVRKSCDDPHNPGKWELPGGRLKDEEELDDQVRREVLEETGFRVEPGRPIDMWSWEMSWNNELVRVVAVSRYCHLIDYIGTSPAREKDDYLDEQIWCPLTELLSYDVISSQLPTIKKIAADIDID